MLSSLIHKKRALDAQAQPSVTTFLHPKLRSTTRMLAVEVPVFPQISQELRGEFLDYIDEISVG